MRTRLTGAVAAIVLAVGAVAAAEERYEIKFSRPSARGDKLRLVAKGSSTTHNRIRLQEQTLHEEQAGVRVELEALLEVLAVDAAGRVIKHSLTVERMIYGRSGEEDRSLSAGQVILAESEGNETRFFLADGELPELAREALSIVANTDSSQIPDDDQTFGTAEPRTVGESWPIDRETTAQALATVGMPVPPESIAGEVRLLELESFEGAECLRIEASMSFRDFALEGLESGMQLQNASAEASFSRLLPTDTNSKLEYDLESFQLNASFQATEGQMAGAVFEISNTRIAEISQIPMADPN